MAVSGAGALNRFRDFLRGEGLKLTQERTALVEQIFASHYHFEADELLARMKEKRLKISRATVYRTLELLVKSGLVRRVHLGEDHYHYENAGEADHDHLICATCGTVIEFRDDELDRRQQEICESRNFTPTYRTLQILGICASCRRKGAKPDAPDRVKMIGPRAMRLRK